MRERVRPVHDRPDALGARRVTDLPDRKDLTGQVGDVTEVKDLGLRGDRRQQAIGEVVQGRGWHRERDLRDDDAIAAGALIPGVEHAPVNRTLGDPNKGYPVRDIVDAVTPSASAA